MKKLLLSFFALSMCLSAAAHENNTSPKKLWLSVDGGFSYRVAKAAPGPMRDFINRMRDGYAFGADIHYEFKPMQAVGLRFSTHGYKNSEWGLTAKSNNWYVGPSYRYRVPLPRGNGAFSAGFSLGYVSLSESANGISLLDGAGGFGSTWDLGYDFPIAEGLWLGFKLSLFDGTIMLTDAYGESVKESLSALDLGVSLKF